MSQFEGRYTVDPGTLPPPYLAERGAWFESQAAVAGALGLKDEALHDALLMMDHAVAAGAGAEGGLPAPTLVVACLLLSARQGQRGDQMPGAAALEAATGQPAAGLEAGQDAVRALLAGDTSSISALRVLKLYLERLGVDFGHTHGVRSVAGEAWGGRAARRAGGCGGRQGRAARCRSREEDSSLGHQAPHLPSFFLPLLGPLPAPSGDALALMGQAVTDPALRHCRPSLLAAAVLAAARRGAGVSPPWPQALLALTGISDAEGGELEAAMDAAASLADASPADAEAAAAADGA